MKYIDAEKLTTIIEERKAQQDQWINRYHDPINQGISHELTEILSIVDSLQQEPRFPQYDNIIEKVFGAGNLEFWERDEAEMLVALAKEELLKSLQQKQPETPSGEEVMNMCNQILIDWFKEGKTPEEREQREQAHIRFFELYDEYMQEQQEGDLEKEIEQWFDLSGISEAWENGEWSTNDIRSTARHFYELGLNARKEE